MNVYVHSWEADHFSMTSSNYAYEIEVKVSRSDFFADFKKPKHNFFKGYKSGYGILRGDESWTKSNDLRYCEHPDLLGHEIRWTHISPLKFSYASAPNKFFYACPVGLIELHEVPEYAGLIYVMDSGDPRVIKKAPFLHKDEFNFKQMLFNKYYYLCSELREKIRGLEWEVEYLKDKIPA
jgi:hypothetical protein